MPTGLDLLRCSAFLRCSEAQPEEKFVHRQDHLATRKPLHVINLFLYLTAFGPMAILFASVVGLACGLLTMCVRAVAWLVKLLAIVKTAPEAPELREFT